MTSGASVGASLADGTTSDRFFSERAAIKLLYAESEANTLTEKEFQSLVLEHYPQGLELAPLFVPNTILEGINEVGGYPELLNVFSLSVRSTTTNFREIDIYRFFFHEGDIVTIEICLNSHLLRDAGIIILDQLLAFFIIEKDNAYSQRRIELNSEPSEGLSPLILDFVVPETSSYALHVVNQRIRRETLEFVAPYDLLVYSVIGPVTLPPTSAPKDYSGGKGKLRARV